MHSGRLYRVNLGSGLIVRGRGSFGNEAPCLEWSQPAEQWQALIVIDGETASINGETSRLAPWSLVIAPPGARCALHWQEGSTYIYDFFGFVPDRSLENSVALPEVTDLGPRGPILDVEFRRGLSRLHASSVQADTVAAAILWSAARPASELRRNVYVAEAERLILAESGPRMRVAELAKAVGLSQVQLSRLFVTEHGTTPLQFIRTAQARLAHDLLTGTAQPIKAVAATCGFPDVHAFNRFVRARLGASPREIRAGIGAVDIFRVEEFRARIP